VNAVLRVVFAQIPTLFKEAHEGSEHITKESFVRVGLKHQLLGAVALKQRSIPEVCQAMCCPVIHRIFTVGLGLTLQEAMDSQAVLLSESWSSSRAGVIRQLSAIPSPQTQIMVTERITQLDKVATLACSGLCGCFAYLCWAFPW
jgi:hypothetical protein